MTDALRGLVLAAGMCLALLLPGGPQPALANNEAVGAEIRRIIEGGVVTVGTDDGDRRLFDVFTYYQDRDYKPLWVRDTGPKAKARDYLDILRAASEDGLDPQNYYVGEIEVRMQARDPETLAELDLVLSRSFIDYGRDLGEGRVKPSEVARNTHIEPKGPGPLTLLDGVEMAEDIGPYVDRLAPQTPNYQRLKDALAIYRIVDARGGWPEIPAGPALKPDMIDPRVPALRHLLIATGDLPSDAPDTGELYAEPLVASVKWFQYRHGLNQDGVIGPGTLEQMNVPVSERIREIELNLERRRWMPDNLGTFYVFVNLADQYLKVVRGERTVHNAKLVVGKPYHQTPVFSQDMTYVVFNPYWNVPTSIAVNEYLPKLRRNPGALHAENIRVLRGESVISPASISWSSYGRGKFPFRLRQDPGPRNALGKIKFMFPNPYNVYIHDTPAKSLFEREVRIFSHGCMRVQYPDRLAAVLLGHDDASWTAERIQAQLATGSNTVVRLKRPIPVHITYLTAWANKDGSVHFRKDVYDRDPQLVAALRKAGYAMN